MVKQHDEEPNVQNAARKIASDMPERALERLFRDHGQRVFRAAYRITGTRQDAEDVLKEKLNDKLKDLFKK